MTSEDTNDIEPGMRNDEWVSVPMIALGVGAWRADATGTKGTQERNAVSEHDQHIGYSPDIVVDDWEVLVRNWFLLKGLLRFVISARRWVGEFDIIGGRTFLRSQG